MKRLTAFLTVHLFFGLAVASAQSLAEMAKKEKERREKNDSTQAKSFSDRDLADFRDTSLIGLAQADAASEEPTELAEPDEEEGEEEDPTRTEAYWRDRLAPLNQRITDLQAQLNRPGFAEDPSNMMQRQRLERDLEQAQREHDAMVQQARKQGVPPGWLR